MDASELKPGIYTVKVEGVTFNISVIYDAPVKGIAGYQIGEKPPRRGKHLLFTDNVRNWISRMELVNKI